MIPPRQQQSFDAFVASTSHRLVRTAYLLCGDRGHAEDLVQTALLRTARRWRQARRHPEAYARQIVVNLAKDRWRHLARRPVEVPIETTTDPGTGSASLNAVLDRDELIRAVGSLPDGQRAVLVLRFLDDLSVADTAAALGCSAGTVKSQTSRALATVRAALTATPAPTGEPRW